MQFDQFDAPDCYQDFDDFKSHWQNYGWYEIPKSAERKVTTDWQTNLETNGKVEIPTPSRRWDNVSTRAMGELAEEMEEDFTLSLLTGLRRCTRHGERLLAIDWQHPWYYFDPHAPITRSTRDEWAMPMLPDVDSYNFVALDFRFGVLTGYDSRWFVCIFGTELLSAFADEPPKRFLRHFGQGSYTEQA